MDKDSFDISNISYNALEVSEMRWNRIMQMMIDNNLISGAKFISADGHPYYAFRAYNIHITIQGLQYLEENSMMKKVSKTLKTIKDMTPML